MNYEYIPYMFATLAVGKIMKYEHASYIDSINMKKKIENKLRLKAAIKKKGKWCELFKQS